MTSGVSLGAFTVIYHGWKLEPTPRFTQFLTELPEQVRKHKSITRLGILANQLAPIEYTARLDPTGDRITNAALTLTIDQHHHLVQSEVEKLVQTALGEDMYYIFNTNTFTPQTRDAVKNLCSAVSDELSDRRKQAIYRFCCATGLLENCNEDPPVDEPRGKDDDSAYESPEMPDVSKL